MKTSIEKSEIQSILIANRGEIASRIIRTCKAMGIRTVAIYSEADRQSPYVTQADRAVNIGAPRPTESYLNGQKIIDLAQKLSIDAIHPGYGFLSENHHFAQLCEEAGIIFIGPHAKAIEQMGSKALAKEIMRKHQVPVIPGYQGEDQSIDKLSEAAGDIGFPLLVKASAGGGGKGMRIVRHPEELLTALSASKREAKGAFGNDRIILEKYIAQSRHIEFQIFGDKNGNVIHLFERECTIQRRYQKVIEESPSPALTEELREQMAQAAIAAGKAISYDNAGTVEFIFDCQSNEFYFLEMNTRLQVEHPVTEAITGLDLVEWQISVAGGDELPLRQSEIRTRGYALETRIYAEDPQKEFFPVSGNIRSWSYPDNLSGFRMESAVKSGSDISIYYDPMIAKAITWGKNRNEAIRKMDYALSQTVCLGLTTNIPFLRAILSTDDFKKGNYDTGFIASNLTHLNDAKTALQLEIPAIISLLIDWKKRDAKDISLYHNVGFKPLKEETYNLPEGTKIE